MKKKSQKQTKHDPRSEAAQREAIRLFNLPHNGQPIIRRDHSFTDDKDFSPTVEFVLIATEQTIAIFDLRDCYRKRKNLVGINKAFRKTIASRGKRKK